MSDKIKLHQIFEVLNSNPEKIIDFISILHDNIFELLSSNQQSIASYREEIAEKMACDTKTIASYMSPQWDKLDMHESNEKVLIMFENELKGCNDGVQEMLYKAMTFTFKVPMYVTDKKHTEQAIGMIQLCLESAIGKTLIPKDK